MFTENDALSSPVIPDARYPTDNYAFFLNPTFPRNLEKQSVYVALQLKPSGDSGIPEKLYMVFKVSPSGITWTLGESYVMTA